MISLHILAIGTILLATPIDHNKAHHNERDPDSLRSRQMEREFQHSHPCPSTGTTSGPCPGYVETPRKPLCRGGAIEPGNLEWQRGWQAERKLRQECPP